MAIDCANDKFVNNLHPGKTDKIINKCNQTPNIRGVTDKCIKQKQNTLELSGQGQTSLENDVTEPDGKYLCNHFSLKCRKRDIIQDVRRSDWLKTKPSISYKDRNLEINNYNVLNIQTLSEEIRVVIRIYLIVKN